MDAERESEETRARLTQPTGDAGGGGRRPQHHAGATEGATADEITHNSTTRCSTPHRRNKSEPSKQ